MADEFDQFVSSLSQITKDRIRNEIAHGDYRRLERLFSQRVIQQRFLADGKSERTARNYRTDLKNGETLPDHYEFVAWDGEGWEENQQHKYTLLANSDGNYIQDSDGLSTDRCLSFMVNEYRKRTINIFYSFGYDIQQIIKDIPDEDIDRLMHGGRIRYHNWSLEYFVGKIFVINNYVRFYDVFPFFHTSFIQAIGEAFGKQVISKELIAGKQARGQFQSWDLREIKKYNDIELDLLRKLGEWLRDIFTEAGINLGRSYYGPGAIAKFWFRQHKIKPIPISNPTLNDVFERAYFGGRFETIAMGKQTPIYEYDIHSAYPAAIRELQYVDDWISVEPEQFNNSSKFSVWHIKWHIPYSRKVGPFPSRDKRGLICYPADGIGWYYKPEIEAAIYLYGKSSIQILEGYNPKYIGNDDPFYWVEQMYNRRAELKAADNPAQMALKLGLNSLYGKTAQRVGSNTFFCLPWAGWITSYTRAKLLRACKANLDSIVAFATDAVYSTKALSVDTTGSLGTWESKFWTEGYFIQSGLYRLVEGSTQKDASRSFASKNVEVLFEELKHSEGAIELLEERFITHSLAIMFPKAFGPYRLRFITIKKHLLPFRPTKRALVLDPFPEKYHTILPVEEEDLEDPIVAERVKKAIHIAPGWYAWPNHFLLLKQSIPTRILKNHNDHWDPVYNQVAPGPLEESYPFVRHTTATEIDLAKESDIILAERVGGLLEQDIQLPDNVPVIDVGLA